MGGQLLQHGGVDPHRPVEIRTAMHDAVADCANRDIRQRPQPVPDLDDGRRQVGDCARLRAAVDQHGAIGVAGAQARPRADPVQLAADAALGVATLHRKELELQTRRAGVDSEDGVQKLRPPRSERPCVAPRRRARRRRRRRVGCAPNPRARSGSRARARRARCRRHRHASKNQVLRQHVAGLEVGDDQDLRAPGDGRGNPLYAGRLGVDGVVEGQRTVD